MSEADDALQTFPYTKFNKPLNELTKEENYTIDCYGIYNIYDWMNDHPEETKRAEKLLRI